MRYAELKIPIKPDHPVEGEIIMAYIAELFYEGFMEEQFMAKAYNLIYKENMNKVLADFIQAGCIGGIINDCRILPR